MSDLSPETKPKVHWVIRVFTRTSFYGGTWFLLNCIVYGVTGSLDPKHLLRILVTSLFYGTTMAIAVVATNNFKTQNDWFERKFRKIQSFFRGRPKEGA